jgi:hypothetical protein
MGKVTADGGINARFARDGALVNAWFWATASDRRHSPPRAAPHWPDEIEAVMHVRRVMRCAGSVAAAERRG